MPMPRLLIPSLLVTVAACASPAPREVDSAPEQPAPSSESAQPAQSAQSLVAAMTERCRATVAGRPNAAVPAAPTAVLMRDDWVQVDGVVEWKGESGEVARNAWTCDMFRGEDGVWQRRYLSYGPV